MAQQALVHLAVAAVAIMLLSGCTVTRTPSASASLGAVTGDVSLVGATPAVLNSTFGVPALRRVDGTAQVWLYHSQVCGLDLILYPDRHGTLRVTMAVPDNGDPAACAASLRRGLTDAALEHATSS